MLYTKEFRMLMAEQGFEYTVDQASKIIGSLLSLKRKLNKTSDVMFMSVEEKRKLRREAAEKGIEISPDEFDSLHEIMMSVQKSDFEVD